MEERKDLFSEYLRKKLDGQQPLPGDGVWEKLSSSLDREQFDQTLRSGFDAFEAAPSPAVLERLMQDLNEGQTLRQSFDAWEESSALPGFDRMRTELNDEVFDHSILESYREWNGGNSRDLWNKLDEELSREAVWMRLQHSLTSYSSSVAAWKTILSVAAMLLLFFHISDESYQSRYTSGYGSLPSSGTETAGIPVAQPASPAASSVAAAPASPTRHPARIAANKDTGVNRSAGQSSATSQRNGAVAGNTAESPAGHADQLAGNEEKAPEYAAVENLPGRAITPEQAVLASRFPELPGSGLKTHFSVEFGPQLAILTERSESNLGTVTPGVGFGGGVNYRYHLGPLTVSHGLSYSRYNQQSGDYINGRYRTGNQQLNAVQFNTTAGFGLNRFDIYGGLVLSRVLSGVEKSGSTVTKVYHFDPIAPGLIAGTNVTLLNFRHAALGAGIQYSWVRGLNNKENSLTNVQGVRLNVIYSF